jgi:hypothetical protein
MGGPIDRFVMWCSKSRHPIWAATFGAKRHISTGATLRIRFLTREIRSIWCNCARPDLWGAATSSPTRHPRPYRDRLGRCRKSAMGYSVPAMNVVAKAALDPPEALAARASIRRSVCAGLCAGGIAYGRRRGVERGRAFITLVGGTGATWTLAARTRRPGGCDIRMILTLAPIECKGPQLQAGRRLTRLGLGPA